MEGCCLLVPLSPFSVLLVSLFLRSFPYACAALHSYTPDSSTSLVSLGFSLDASLDNTPPLSRMYAFSRPPGHSFFSSLRTDMTDIIRQEKLRCSRVGTGTGCVRTREAHNLARALPMLDMVARESPPTLRIEAKEAFEHRQKRSVD